MIVNLFNKLISLARTSYIRSPNKATGNRGGIVITHREYVRDITPSSAFTKWDFPLQPGLGITFPWLAQLAESYEEYKIKAMVFEYKSLCSDTIISAGTSAGLGSVILATNYNPNKQPFVDKRTMENYEGCVARKPSQSIVHAVNMSQQRATKWVRTGGIDDNEDKRLYDAGVFSVATVGQDAAMSGTIGELWVAYEIEFFKPKYSGSVGSALLTDHYATDNTKTAGFTGIGPFGVTPRVFPPNQLKGANTYIDFVPGNPGTNRLNFRPEHQGMTFMVICQWKGTGAAGLVQAITSSVTNVTAVSGRFNRGTVTSSSLSAGAGAAGGLADLVSHMGTYTVLPAANGPWNIVYTFSAGIIPGGTVGLDIFVMQINGTPEPGYV